MRLPNDSVPRPEAVSRELLNILEQRHNPQFYEALATIMKIRQKYIEQRAVFIPGSQLIPVLIGLGAKSEDFDALRATSDRLGPDPTVDFRTIRLGRYCIDVETKNVRRLEKQLFNLTVKEGYKRHDSGILRDFPEVEEDLQCNTVSQALMLFKILVYHKVPITPRENLDYLDSNWMCQFFSVRTFTEKDIQGHPTLEGVHSDGGDHTMTVFLNSANMTSDSAVTFMHDKAETTGIPVQDTRSVLIKGRIQHQNFLDTLMFTDNEFKHSLTPIYQADKSKRATRDMLVIITRKPRAAGHATGMRDSFKLHPRFSMQIPLWLP